MRKAVIFIFSLILSFGLFSCQKEGSVSSNSSELNRLKDLPWPKIVFGTKSHPGGDTENGSCGCCTGDKGICLIIGATLKQDGDQLTDGKGFADVSINSNNKLVMRITDDYHQQTSSTLVVEDYKPLESSAASALGYSQVTIHPGNYSVDYSNSSYPYGIVELDVTLVP